MRRALARRVRCRVRRCTARSARARRPTAGHARPAPGRRGPRPGRAARAAGARRRWTGDAGPGSPAGPGPRRGVSAEGTVRTCLSLPSENARPAAVLLVDRLATDPEADRDLLPGPALRACVLDLQGLEPLGHLAQRAYRPQPHLRVAAAR